MTLESASSTAPSVKPWKAIAETTCAKLPPLWPLESFVAVNPFLGLSGESFADSTDRMQRVAHGPMLPETGLYLEKLQSGAVTDADLTQALHIAKAQGAGGWADALEGTSPAELKLWLHDAKSQPGVTPIYTVADALDQVKPGHWAKFVEDEISKWCAAYYDEKQSSWRMPWSELGLYAAWREAAKLDAQPALLGVKGFRKLVASLPASAEEALVVLMQKLGVDEVAADGYLHRALMSISGWAGFVQFRVRKNSMAGVEDDSLVQLLVIRLAYDAALLGAFDSAALREFWSGSFVELDEPISKELALHNVWQLAIECSYQRSLIGQVGQGKKAATADLAEVQAVFCIDVRSEVFRRSLEAVSPTVETLGFAGFFAMSVAYQPIEHEQNSARVPVLLSPAYTVKEKLTGLTPAREAQKLEGMALNKRIRHAWNAFKTSAISCFSFVETAGLAFGVKLFKSSFATKGAEADRATAPDVIGCSHGGCGHDHGHGSDTHGIPPEAQVALAKGALTHMGLKQDFARIVLLCGHGSETVNNPYAAGLDCGACGGHAGDANARIAATLLNMPQVRTALAADGIVIPESTWFMAGLHNTTTDEVTLFETEKVPASHQADLKKLTGWLAAATKQTRVYRAPTLGLSGVGGADLDAQIELNAADWSQVRPEWALAGNAAFIAAPRERTRHMNLEGRSFLHNYKHSTDEGCGTLELILVAPVIVASWINLQYYASTVNNAKFGSGNKVTHNVVGTLGVCQGNGGDLKTGLPLQSVHDGEKWMHEPLRLSIFIEAPREAISLILEKHANVRELFDNGWLHLFALEDEGKNSYRYLPGQRWELAAA